MLYVRWDFRGSQNRHRKLHRAHPSQSARRVGHPLLLFVSASGRLGHPPLVNIGGFTLNPKNAVPTTGNVHVGETNPNQNLWEHLKQVF